jgi:hypothetical protein
LNYPILVTGAPRSGTTFLGQILALPSRVTYIDEPLNYQIGMKGVKQQFIYLFDGAAKEEYYVRLLKGLLSGRARFKHHSLSKPPTSFPDAAVRLRIQLRQYFRYKVTGLDFSPWRYLLKDPMACFSAEYLHQKMQMPTVIIVRHPAAVIRSYRQLGWRFSLSHLVNQPDLMKHYLKPVLSQININNVSDIEEGALLWTSIYKVLSVYAERNPNMILIRHEDLSAEPEVMFERLYRRLGLPFNDWFVGRIRDYTNISNPVSPPDGVAHQLRRNSRAIASQWHDGFTQRELLRIWELTANVAD